MSKLPRVSGQQVVAALERLGLTEFAFRAPARTQRCAGEGELVFGLINHGAILSERGRDVKGQIRAVSAGVRA